MKLAISDFIRNLFLYFDFELNLYDLSANDKISKYYLRQCINICITKCQDEHNIFIILQVGTRHLPAINRQ